MGSALMEVLATRDFAEVPLLLSPPRPAGEGSIHPVHVDTLTASLASTSRFVQDPGWTIN